MITGGSAQQRAGHDLSPGEGVAAHQLVTTPTVSGSWSAVVTKAADRGTAPSSP
jgi:hypothetical protein